MIKKYFFLAISFFLVTNMYSMEQEESNPKKQILPKAIQQLIALDSPFPGIQVEIPGYAKVPLHLAIRACLNRSLLPNKDDPRTQNFLNALLESPILERTPTPQEKNTVAVNTLSFTINSLAESGDVDGMKKLFSGCNNYTTVFIQYELPNKMLSFLVDCANSNLSAPANQSTTRHAIHLVACSLLKKYSSFKDFFEKNNVKMNLPDINAMAETWHSFLTSADKKYRTSTHRKCVEYKFDDSINKKHFYGLFEIFNLTMKKQTISNTSLAEAVTAIAQLNIHEIKDSQLVPIPDSSFKTLVDNNKIEEIYTILDQLFGGQLVWYEHRNKDLYSIVLLEEKPTTGPTGGTLVNTLLYTTKKRKAD